MSSFLSSTCHSCIAIRLLESKFLKLDHRKAQDTMTSGYLLYISDKLQSAALPRLVYGAKSMKCLQTASFETLTAPRALQIAIN